jgi:23S rRNA pseudouridine2605 synthase
LNSDHLHADNHDLETPNLDSSNTEHETVGHEGVAAHAVENDVKEALASVPTSSAPAESAPAEFAPAVSAPAVSAPGQRVGGGGGQTPSADQLSTNRSAHWHQDGKALLSIEAMREWISRSGLVAYGPRVVQMGAPAPSLVEATLGRKLDGAAELSESDAARNLLSRLIADGSVVPLNLLGVTGGTGTDVPDYVASAAVFSFIFTLRGNKAWKQAPVTSGAVKVSPLALATYEILAAKVTMSAYDLVTQLGKEVTEGAVLRALTELWSQLRVIPVPQQDGTATLWELASARYTKQIKAGANAGQPTALSALISLYLGQAVAATEAEIETFLSPLAPRSRVRDVIHALLSARQLETVVIDGKTLLHVAGDLPAFAAAPVVERVATEDGSRISKFAARPGSKIGTGLRSKPAFGSKPGFGKKPAYGSKPSFGDRQGSGDRDRRPFKRDDKPAFRSDRSDRPRFDKPWSERPAAPAASEGFAASASGEGMGEASAPRAFTPREGSGEAPRRSFSKPGTFGRKREGFGGGDSRPPRRDFGSDSRPPRRDFGSDSRPPRRDFGSDSRPPRRDFGSDSRPAASGGSDRPARGGYADRGERPGGFKASGGSAGSYTPRPKPAFGGSDRGGDRPDRGGFAGKPAFGRKPPFGDRPSFGAKPGFQRDRPAGDGAEAPRKVFRKFDAPRDKKPFGAKPFGAKPFSAKPFGAKPFGDRPARSFDGPRPERSFDGPRPARSFDGPRPARSFDGPRPERSGGDRPRSSEGRPSYGVKNGMGGRPAGGGFSKAGGPFAKFADGKKPFRKPGPGSKPSSGGGKKYDKPAGGGYRPTKRRAE